MRPENHFKNIDNYRPTALTALSAHGRLSIYHYHRLTPSDCKRKFVCPVQFQAHRDAFPELLIKFLWPCLYFLAIFLYTTSSAPVAIVLLHRAESTILHLLTPSLSHSLGRSLFSTTVSFLSERSRGLGLANNISISICLYNSSSTEPSRHPIVSSSSQPFPLSASPPASETLTISHLSAHLTTRRWHIPGRESGFCVYWDSLHSSSTQQARKIIISVFHHVVSTRRRSICPGLCVIQLDWCSRELCAARHKWYWRWFQYVLLLVSARFVWDHDSNGIIFRNGKCEQMVSIGWPGVHHRGLRHGHGHDSWSWIPVLWSRSS